MNLEYEFKGASVYNIKEVNSSFAVGSLKVLYTGANRNGSIIDRDVIEAALPSLYNVPIVCHYDFDENIIGGHDIAVARNQDGELRLRVLTEPCGVVPDHAVFHFENEMDESGVEHEYLVIDGVILWKRQDVYGHIVNDLNGCVKHSMEITVNDGASDPSIGMFRITDFEFTALCLLERFDPCFQGSSLNLYSAKEFKSQMEQMMKELKETFSMVTSSSEDDDTHSHNHSKEGGMTLPEKFALIEQYGFTVENLGFAIDELSLEELEFKLKEMSQSRDSDQNIETADFTEEEPGSEQGAEPEEDENSEDKGEGDKDDDPTPIPDADLPDSTTDDGDDDVSKRKRGYALSGQIAEDLSRELGTETVMMPWGEDHRYWYWDHDQDKMEVYCTDCTDWLLYGFTYSMNGDAVSVDFGSKKRMKLVVADYEDGASDQYAKTMSAFAEKYTGEIALLSEFKHGVETAALNERREEVLSHFADLAGIEAFEEIRERIGEYSVEELEEKCYAVRGRYGTSTKFSFEQKQPKLPINKTEQPDEPYGGLFVKYNNVAKTN